MSSRTIFCLSILSGEISFLVGARVVKALIPTYCTLSTFGNERLSSHLVILSVSEESHALGTEILRYALRHVAKRSAPPPIIHTSVTRVRLIVKGCSFYRIYRSHTAQNKR